MTRHVSVNAPERGSRAAALRQALRADALRNTAPVGSVWTGANWPRPGSSPAGYVTAGLDGHWPRLPKQSPCVPTQTAPPRLPINAELATKNCPAVPLLIAMGTLSPVAQCLQIQVDPFL